MQSDDLDTLIQSRRSIRKYKKEVPPAALIMEMVSAASFAPSPSNSQPVRFFNLTRASTKERLYQAMEKGRDELIARIEARGISSRESRRKKNIIAYYWRYSAFMFNAPVILAVGTRFPTESFSTRLNEGGMDPSSHNEDRDSAITLGLALKGFLLKAQALGLGTCILTAPLHFISHVNKILGIENVRVHCFTTVGFPDESPRGVGRKNIEEIYKEI